jgi:cytochrome c556
MKRFIVAAAAAGVLSSGSALAQFAKPEQAVAYRESVMTVMGHHFGIIGAMAQGKMPFSAAGAAANAEIVETMSKLPFVAFIEGTASSEKGKAKANIWTERPKFDHAAKKMQEAVVELVAATKTGDEGQIKSAFGNVGKACKACHDDFRNK